jgi:hypothetical protein
MATNEAWVLSLVLIRGHDMFLAPTSVTPLRVTDASQPITCRTYVHNALEDCLAAWTCLCPPQQKHGP